MRHGFCAVALAVAAGLLMSGCAAKHAESPFAGAGSPRYPGNGPLPKGGGRYVVGEPYQVAGTWFRPGEQPNYDKVGIASWYGLDYHRRQTSNGEWFDMNYPTAAHATLPLPSYAKVTNLENGRELIVRINDRGPFVGTRVIDLSRRSAEVLGMKGQGTAKVRVQYIGPAPLNDKGTQLALLNRELERGTPLRQMTAEVRGGAAPSRPTMVAAVRKEKPVRPPALSEPAEEPMEPQTEVAAVEPEPVQPFEPLGPRTEAFGQSGYFVQVGSFSNPENAEKMRLKLAGLGPVEVMPLESALGVLYRVRVGPLADQGDAETTLQQVVDAGHADARLIVSQRTL
jgi:rare lipoprotein A